MNEVVERLIDSEITRLEGEITELRQMKTQMVQPTRRARQVRRPRKAKAAAVVVLPAATGARLRIPAAERVAQAVALLQERGEMTTQQLAEALGMTASGLRGVMRSPEARKRIKESYIPRRGEAAPTKYVAK